MALADMANQEVTADQIQDVVEQQEQVCGRVWGGSGCRMERTLWSSRWSRCATEFGQAGEGMVSDGTDVREGLGEESQG